MDLIKHSLNADVVCVENVLIQEFRWSNWWNKLNKKQQAVYDINSSSRVSEVNCDTLDWTLVKHSQWMKPTHLLLESCCELCGADCAPPAASEPAQSLTRLRSDKD